MYRVDVANHQAAYKNVIFKNLGKKKNNLGFRQRTPSVLNFIAEYIAQELCGPLHF